MPKPLALLAAGVLVLAVLPLALPFSTFVLTLAVAKGFAALGVALLLRAGLISLGHAMYFAIGAYATAFLMQKAGTTDFVLLIAVSTVLAAIVGLVFGAFLVRYRAIFFAMLNLAVSMVIYALASKLYGITGGTDGLRVGVPTVLGWAPEKPAFDSFLLYATLALMLVVGWLVHRYLKSPLGHALAAVHTNEVRLEYLGVSAWSTLLTAYGVSAGLAGLGGALSAMAIGHVLPEFAFWTESGHLVLTAVLGGVGGVAGPFIGSIFLELVHVVAVGVAAEAWNLIIGVALICVIFFLPRVLFGLIEGRRGKAQGGEL
jgi:branched-chain amino acid transport system permease protein